MELSRLILTQKGSRTYAQLEKDCGGSPRSARIQQLATGRIKNFIDPPTVRALARGLGVTQIAVVLATAETLGLDVSRATPRVLDYLPPGVDKLDDSQLHAIGQMIAAFTREVGQVRDTPVLYEVGTGRRDYLLIDNRSTDPAPPADPLATAADEIQGPTQYEQVTRGQDSAGEEDQADDT